MNSTNTVNPFARENDNTRLGETAARCQEVARHRDAFINVVYLCKLIDLFFKLGHYLEAGGTLPNASASFLDFDALVYLPSQWSSLIITFKNEDFNLRNVSKIAEVVRANLAEVVELSGGCTAIRLPYDAESAYLCAAIADALYGMAELQFTDANTLERN